MIADYRYKLATGEPVAGTNNCNKTKVFETISYTKHAISLLTGVPPEDIEVIRVFEDDKCLWAINQEEMNKRFLQ